jgi:ribonuclease R
MYTDIFIPKDKIGEAEQGDVVLVHIEDWPARADSPFGSVIKVLGKPGDMIQKFMPFLLNTDCHQNFL